MGLLDILAAAWAPPLMRAEDQYKAHDKIARGLGSAVDHVVGFPQRYMQQYQPGQSVRDNPAATNWGAEMALNMVGTPGGVGGLGSGARIRAYHGSPHDFDKFDLGKIGTGEGAQAYGHGLYFAENPKVAESYKITPNQKTMGPAADWVGRAGGDWRKALSMFDEWVDGLRQSGFPATEAQSLVRADLVKGNTPGRMYEVDIKAHPEQFLDWDKPLKDMGEPVKEALHKAWLAHRDDHAKQLGGQIYESARIVPGDYRDPAAASKTLRDAGIPGIKYLDQGSRAVGDGSRNYVVFDDKLIDIIRKYGLAGVPAGGLLSGALSDQQ